MICDNCQYKNKMTNECDWFVAGYLVYPIWFVPPVIHINTIVYDTTLSIDFECDAFITKVDIENKINNDEGNIVA